MSTEKYDVYSEFDIEMHKNTYINYLEIVIERNGKIHYAVPSHIMKLEHLLMDKYKIEKDELNKLYREECEDCCSTFGYLEWLMDRTGAITVHNTIYRGKANRVQISVLKKLVDSGIITHYSHFCPNDEDGNQLIYSFLSIDWSKTHLLNHQYQKVLNDKHTRRQLEKYMYPLPI